MGNRKDTTSNGGQSSRTILKRTFHHPSKQRKASSMMLTSLLAPVTRLQGRYYQQRHFISSTISTFTKTSSQTSVLTGSGPTLITSWKELENIPYLHATVKEAVHMAMVSLCACQESIISRLSSTDNGKSLRIPLSA